MQEQERKDIYHRFLSDPNFRSQIEKEVTEKLPNFQHELTQLAPILLRELKLYGSVNLHRVGNMTIIKDPTRTKENAF